MCERVRQKDKEKEGGWEEGRGENKLEKRHLEEGRESELEGGTRIGERMSKKEVRDRRRERGKVWRDTERDRA